MTLILRNPEDVVNDALVRIGYPMRVTNMFDGSRAANAALAIYGQTRDELLRQNDWGFAQRNMVLTLLKTAPAGGYVPPISWTPAFPPLPWKYEYAYPDDCLKVRALKPVPILLPVVDPQPVIYAVDNDNAYAPAKKVLLCNVASAVLIYTGQIIDPVTWEADFAETLCAELGRRLAPLLTTPDMAKFEADDAIVSKVTAEKEQG